MQQQESGLRARLSRLRRGATPPPPAPAFEQRLQATAVEAAAAAVIGTSLEGTLVYWNAAAEQIYGYAAAEVIGRPLALLWPADQADTGSALLARLARGEAVAWYETAHSTKDGGRRDVLLSGTPVRDAAGGVDGGVLIARDLDEEKRREGALLANQAQMENIIASAMDAVIATDEEQRIVLFNAAAEQMFQYPAAAVLSQPLEMLIPARFRRAHAGHIRNFGRTHVTSRRMGALGSIRGLRASGEEFPIEASISQSGAGDAKLFTVILRDISERMRTEESLALMAAIVENSDDAIIGKTTDGIIVSWNRGAQRIYGYSADEVLGRPITILAPPDRQDEIPQILERLKRGESIDHLETVRVRQDGQSIAVALTISPIRNAAGEVTGASTIARDITERKRAEQERRAKEAAEEANRAKSEFLSRISHELRTPLNAILGFAQILDLGDLTPDQRASLDYIRAGGRHLLELINEVLDIARIESGRLALSPEPVSVAELLTVSLDLVRPMAGGRDLRILATQLDPCHHHVIADRQRLQQVLLNLLANAVKYNRPGGSIALLCEEATPERLRIGVRDTGIGIPAEKISRLFVPFDRLGAEQSGIEGTGLGLALARRLMEAMDGTILVESEVGVGSTFWLELPITESPEAQLARTGDARLAAPTLAGPRRRVLYIEDNLASYRLIERLLSGYPNLELLAAMQGLLGLDLAAEHHPDLILLDLHLPDINGDEVLARLRASEATRDIPVVIMSADATPKQIERLRGAGAHAYLTKPIDVARFLTMLDEVLQKVGGS